MKNSNTVRWGVIGLGFFGEVHADTLAVMPGIELAALCECRKDRLDELADRHNVSKRYTNYHDMLADPEVDVVSITTHIDDHRDIAVDALRSGKNVFLEKPMASTVADCDKIVEAAAKSDGLFTVGHICRFDPRVAMAKEAIDDGRIGKIISMHSRRNLSKVIGDQVLDNISALMGDGIHDTDLMLWFSQSKPVTIYAQEVHPGKHKYPDGAWVMMRLENNAIAVVESIWHLPETTPYQIDARMEIIGTEGAIYINCAEAGLTIHDANGGKKPDTMYWPYPLGERFGILRAELRYFGNCVAKGIKPDRITPEESRLAVAVINAAAESSKTGQVVRL